MATLLLCCHVLIVMSLPRALNHRLVSHFPLSLHKGLWRCYSHISGDELAWDRDDGNAALGDALVAGEGRQRG